MATGAAASLTREELVSLLFEAAELEHGLCCSYLYAAFTLKRTDDTFTAEQSDAVQRWRKLINSVAREEMLHLSLVSNLLTALGGPPHFRRPPFPQRSRYYPPGITVELLPFSDETMTRFLYIERPEGVDVSDIDPVLEAELDAVLEEDDDALSSIPGALQTVTEEDDEAPVAQAELLTVGHLYAAIDDGLRDLTDRLGEEAVFIGPAQAQATPDYFRFPNLVPATGLASAQAVLGLLVEQGEGTRGDWGEAHYGRFHDVREELRRLRRADSTFEPAHPALVNPYVSQPDGQADGARVDDPTTAKVMELFNGCYQTMTHLLVRFFAHSGESDEALRALVAGAIAVMEDAIEQLGKVLVTMPAGPSHPHATAGPSFEFYRSVSMSPHRRAVWLVLHERLCELADFADRLVDEDAPTELSEVATALRNIAASLEPHLDRAPIFSR